jgi:transcriptional regulator GlxA family with amidase domain
VTGRARRSGHGSRERLIAFLVYPGASLLDIAGPLRVLTRLGRPFRAVLVGTHVGPMATDTPLATVPNTTFAEVPAPHALVVPGGGLGMVKAMVDPTVTDYVATSVPSATLIASVCTGALLLAAAGVLEGRRAATHWGYATYLERLGARYSARRLVEDGPFITAAGSTAGVDMALRVAERLRDHHTALRIQTELAHDRVAPTVLSRGAIDSPTPLGHLTRAEALGRLASMRLILAARPDLLTRLDP